MDNQPYTSPIPQPSPDPQTPAPVDYTSLMVQPKPLFSLTKRDTAFAVGGVVASVFASIFGIFGGFAFGYLLSILLMTVLMVLYFAGSGKISALSVVAGLLSVANSAIFVCTSNGSVRFFGVLVSFLLSLLCFDGLVTGKVTGNRQTLGVFYSAASTVGNVGLALKSLFSHRDGEKSPWARCSSVCCAPCRCWRWCCRCLSPPTLLSGG